jgi:hypothetical protein
MADTQVRDGRRRCRRRAGKRERMRVKDDCMSNLRHGDYDYATFALVLLLHSFFAQPSSNPIRRTRLFLLCIRACMCARACAYTYIYIHMCGVCMCVTEHLFTCYYPVRWTRVLLIFFFGLLTSILLFAKIGCYYA